MYVCINHSNISRIGQATGKQIVTLTEWFHSNHFFPFSISIFLLALWFFFRTFLFSLKQQKKKKKKKSYYCTFYFIFFAKCLIFLFHNIGVTFFCFFVISFEQKSIWPKYAFLLYFVPLLD